MKKIKIIMILFLIVLLIPIVINFYVIYKSKYNIFGENDTSGNYDIVMVLGCSVRKNGEPSKMLKDRLDKAISLYKSKKASKILISGDHSTSYSEIDAMYNYLLNLMIPKEDIYIDSKGYSTNKSLLNYKEKYNAKSLIIVTQEYHLYRALFIAKKIKINAVGVYAKKINYHGQIFREIREILARNKDFMLFTFFK